MANRVHTHGKHSQKDDFGQRWEIASYLVDGPRTVEEIGEHYQSYLRFIGLFSIKARLDRDSTRKRLNAKVQDCLDRMLADGWVVIAKDRYEITDIGRAEAEKMLVDMRQARELLKKAAKPETVSRVSLAIHLVLAVPKLVAGYLSGSVGLLNDAMDTLLDGLSSLLVYFGIRYRRERLVNIILVALMLGTGIFTLAESINRLIHTETREFSWIALAASIVSLVVCGLLGLYQYSVGRKSGLLMLITQSLDSRNHVLVAVGVIIGLVFIAVDIVIVDTLVGLAIAALILKSGIELAIEVWKTGKDGEVDLSRYEMGLVRNYKKFRVRELGGWMMYMILNQGILDEKTLIHEAQASLNFESNPALRELGWAGGEKNDGVIKAALEYLQEKNFLEFANGKVNLTDKGLVHLRSKITDFDRRFLQRLDKGI